MKQDEVKFLLQVAQLAAKRSKAIRLQVGGAVTDSKGNLVATGYNGTVNGTDNTCEIKVYVTQEDWEYFQAELELCVAYPFEDNNGRYKLVTDESSVIHCEQNLIAHAARRGISIDGGTVFLTHSPCAKCTGLLIQSGVQEVVYLEEYRLHGDIYKKYCGKIKFTQYEDF